MRYLLICTNQLEKLQLIDTVKTSRELVLEAIKDTDRFDAVGILSNYKDPFTAKFQRTRSDNVDGVIKLSDRPQRYTGDELVSFLHSLLVRGKDKSPRKMSENSLRNLKPAQSWTRSTRPNKPRKITDDLIAIALRKREQKISWSTIGKQLGVNNRSLATAVRNHNKRLETQLNANDVNHH